MPFLCDLVKQVAGQNKIKGIGVSLAGRVNHETGLVYNAPNMPQQLKNFALGSKLSQSAKLPVKVDNDVHCFTLAEHKYGQARGYKHVVGLTLGTGVGGGIIVDNKLYRGKDNTSGEFGHTIIVDQFPKGYKKFEQLASGTAIEKAYQVLTKKKLSAKEIELAACKGQKNAVDTYRLMSHYLAVGLINVINTINPEIIVIGGGLSQVKSGLWLRPAVQELKKLAITQKAGQTKVVVSKLAEKANVLGATLLYK